MVNVLSRAIRDEVERLTHGGWRASAIAEELHISPQTVRSIRKKRNLPGDRRGPGIYSEVERLTRGGWKVLTIAEKLSLDPTTVRRIRKRGGLPTDPMGTPIAFSVHAEEVERMTARGYGRSVIAAQLRIHPETVTRIRRALGIVQPQRGPITTEEDRRIRDMLEDGCPITEIAETVRRSPETLYKRYPGQGSSARVLSQSRVRELRRELGI